MPKSKPTNYRTNLKKKVKNSLFDPDNDETSTHISSLNQQSNLSGKILDAPEHSYVNSSTVQKIFLESNSESESSADEYLQDPSQISYHDLDIPRQFHYLDKCDGVISKSSDDPNIDKDSEYFDFSSIIKSQQQLLERNHFEKSGGSDINLDVCAGKESFNESCSLNISDLLAIGESKHNVQKLASKVEHTFSGSNNVEIENLEITIPLSNPVSKNKSGKKLPVQKVSAVNREERILLHKVHLLCLIGHGNYLNQTINYEEILALALSIIPSENFFPPKHANLEYLEKFVVWFSKKINLEEVTTNKSSLLDVLMENFRKKRADSIDSLVCMFISVLRALGMNCRLIMSLQPISVKFNKVKTRASGIADVGDLRSVMASVPLNNADDYVGKIELNKGIISLRDYNSGNENTTQVKKEANALSSVRSNKKVRGSKKLDSEVSRRIKDSVEVDIGNSSKVLTPKSKPIKSHNKKKKIETNIWAEVYVEEEEKWISVDVKRSTVHCVHQLYTNATQPVSYILGWNNDQTIKDLTRRYAPQWMTVTRKLRVDPLWWNKTLSPWKPKKSAIEKEEDRDLDKILEEKPLPSNVTEYKNHPLYVLKRHLLKFEAIYPPDISPLGYVRGEPVYSRFSVCKLHSRETWMRQAKVVRIKEEPYKLVKSRPKYDKLSGSVIEDTQLKLFGQWQVEDYIPPISVDGKVPKNEYGNIELYKPSMLPKGTVHLQLPGLNRVAKKLDIDCASAVVGWEFGGGGSHPVFDGFVVCEEFKETLLDAWNMEADESARRTKEKWKNRVYGNWRKLIRGLLIRDRLQKRYQFGISPSSSEYKKGKQSKKRKL